MSATTERKYNPGFLTDDELVAGFCVRKPEFESVMEMLSECTGSANQHQIVIGPRGSGKTTLLLRAAAELRRDAGLARAFFPVVFAEESYEVGTTGEFWLECVSRLAAQAPRVEGAPDLQRTFDDLRTVRDDQALADRCLATVLDFADREDKRLVLVVENLNMLFRDMVDPDDGWRLRHVLQNEPRIVLLASATSRFDEIDHPDHALYDLFRVLTLRPLDTDECAALWEAASGQSRPRQTIRSLEILTGGSPRLLAIVAHFSAGLSFRQLMDSLLDLVDAHTEYFKSHLEALPAQERRVYLALADLWKPALTKEIADRARIETGKCSAQLARLVERGAVLVSGGSPRRKQYYLSERLYNIYYLLRRNSRPNRLIEVLVRFMESYYAPDELKDIATGIAREAEELPLEMRSLYESAANQLVALSELAEEQEANMEEARKLRVDGIDLWNQGRRDDARAAFAEFLAKFGGSKTPRISEPPVALFNRGVILGILGRSEEELATYDEVLERFGDSEAHDVLALVAESLFNKGGVLRTLNRLEDALVVYDELVQRFSDSETPTLFAYAAKGLLNKGATLDGLNRTEEELAAYSELLRRFGEDDTPSVLEAIGKALTNQGVTLGRLNRPTDALAAYDEVLRRFGNAKTPILLEVVARALVNRGGALRDLNRLEDALAAQDEVLRRFRDCETPVLLDAVARALGNRGVALRALGRTEEALSAYGEVVRRFRDSETAALLEAVARALLYRAFALRELNRPEEELAAYDEVLSRFGKSETPALLDQVLKAFACKTQTLTELGRPLEVPDVESLLALVPKLDALAKYALDALIAYSVQLGPARMRDLILASPAADSLLPLTTALERELGKEPRVPKEVEEVAKDIQEQLAKLRKAPPP